MHAEHAIGRLYHGGLTRACRVMADVIPTVTPLHNLKDLRIMANYIHSLCLIVALTTVLSASDTIAQTLEFRQLSGGLIRVQNEAGMDVAIRPGKTKKSPAQFQPKQELVLGDEFKPMLVSLAGELVKRPDQTNEPIPMDGVLIESVMIGDKRAGIQIKTKSLNILVASLDLVSDQGWIPSKESEKIDLLILTVDDAKKLDTARTNLWLSGIVVKQIALNSTTTMSVATMEKFYASLGRNRTLPTAVLPMIQVPNKNLEFGDRQVVLLKELE
jgi:hypothetical protein